MSGGGRGGRRPSPGPQGAGSAHRRGTSRSPAQSIARKCRRLTDAGAVFADTPRRVSNRGHRLWATAAFRWDRFQSPESTVARRHGDGDHRPAGQSLRRAFVMGACGFMQGGPRQGEAELGGRPAVPRPFFRCGERTRGSRATLPCTTRELGFASSGRAPHLQSPWGWGAGCPLHKFSPVGSLRVSALVG